MTTDPNWLQHAREARAELDSYDQPTPASGMPHTPAQGAAWSDADRVCAFDGCGESCRHDPEATVPAAQPGAGDAETSGTGSGRGTGGTELHISAQAFQDPTQWTIPADETQLLAAHGVIRSKHSVRFEPEPDYPPALIPTESLPSLARFINALKARHYLDAAASLRNLGHTAAAERLESYVRDLDEEAGR